MYSNNKFAKMDSIANLIKTILEADTKAKMEELKGNQHKIDKNKNNKIDAQDFKILRGGLKAEAENDANEPKKPEKPEKSDKEKEELWDYMQRRKAKKQKTEAVNNEETVSEGRPYSASHRIGRYGYTRGSFGLGSSNLDLGGRREAPPAPKPTTPAPTAPAPKPTGSKKTNEEAGQEELHPKAHEVLKHIKPEFHHIYKPYLTKHIFKNNYRDRADLYTAAERAGHAIEEEVEQIDEISQALKNRVQDARRSQAVDTDLGWGPEVPGHRPVSTATKNRLLQRVGGKGNELYAKNVLGSHLGKRSRGDLKAAESYELEEVEQINEIGDTPAGRQMLGRYIKKAARRVGVHSAIAKDYSNTADDNTASPAQRMAAKTLGAQQKHKRDMRLRGVERATNRLTKEENEYDNMSHEELEKHVDDLRERANALKDKAKTSKSARTKYYELVKQHHEASQKLYGIDEAKEPGFRASYGIGRKGSTAKKATQASGRRIQGRGYDSEGNERKAPEGHAPVTSLMPGHDERAAKFLARQAKGRVVKGKAQSAPQKEEVQIDEMKAGASAGKENKFHKKLDKLVHGTFGASSDEKKMKKEEIDPKKTMTDTLKGREKTSDNPFLSKKVMMDVPDNVKEQKTLSSLRKKK